MTTEATQADTPQDAPAVMEPLPPNLIDETINRVLKDNRNKLAAQLGKAIPETAQPATNGESGQEEQAVSDEAVAKEPEAEAAPKAEEEQEKENGRGKGQAEN